MSILVSMMLLVCSLQPTETHLGLIQKGKASFYSKRFNGRKTAHGERHKSGELTAAHRTLPLNTMVEVTNLSNNRSVIVRINDRGPFRGGRIIDLAHSAAKTIGMLRQGVTNVAIRVVGHNRKVLLQPSDALLTSAQIAYSLESVTSN